ncbi:methionyl-tRNA formyltransferase [Ahniella affigens]|uniref:Methionyl-tRNA formyltransferase n=1 Tax=Ahniella affigens TaxID=2021234 RepID=A0A2P1PWX6_9GAMM|nr:methionyl-tRNA formyltransferase [Ahniella affigens]AVP99336.1 methionyl-tRNA formyltransferase [Ahniella affigens]
MTTPASSLRIVFAGTPEFAVPCLDAVLASGHQCVAVYTQPDRPAGRGRGLVMSPVKQRALAAGVPVMQPEHFKQAADRDALAALAPDLMVVVAYGLILPSKVLAIPRHGCWNVHASLLPRWRGAAPIQRAIEAGDTETGVCLMQMEKGLDTGPVLLRVTTPITHHDTGGSLHDRLSALGATCLADGLARLASHQLPAPEVQPDVGVTYAHKLDKAEAELNFDRSAEDLANRVRAFNPWPIAETKALGERLRVYEALADATSGAPGTLLQADRHGLLIGCGQGSLRLTRIQREGGKVISAADYLNARPDLRA